MEQDLKPELTVFMPVYNGEKYIKGAIESILGQTLKNFVFLIINDGSTDNSGNIIKSYRDSRIKYVSNKKNSGLAAIRNLGLDLSGTKYVAFQDCDDISYPSRLEKQLDYLKKHQAVGAVGAWTKCIGENEGYVSKYYCDPQKIRSNLLFFTSIAQPAAMINNGLFKKYALRYDAKFFIAEDYDLFVRASTCFELANLPEVLLGYRLHKSNISKHGSSQYADEIKIRQIKNLGLNPNSEDILIHKTLAKPKAYELGDFLDKKENWLIKLLSANKMVKFYETLPFEYVIRKNWLLACQANSMHGYSVFRRCLDCELMKNNRFHEYRPLLKLLIKTTVRK